MSKSIGSKTSLSQILIFTLPSMAMLFITSLYTLVDGIFVSRYISEVAMSAVNVFYPIIGFIQGITFMFATGGSAVIAKYLGQGENQKAKSTATFVITFATAVCILLTLIFYFTLPYILPLIGGSVSEELYNYALQYGYIYLIGAPFLAIQSIVANYLIINNKAKYAFMLSIISAVINILFDFVFLQYTDLGIIGPAIATISSIIIAAVVGGLIFILSKKNDIRFSKFSFNLKEISFVMFNGSSEMVTSIAVTISSILFNVIIGRQAGNDGIAAISIILYSQFLLTSLMIGFTIGVSQLISFQYGAQNKIALNKIVKNSLIIVGIINVLMTVVCYFTMPYIALIFTEPNSGVYNLLIENYHLIVYAFLFCGFSIFISGLFTAFNNGKISAILSFCRSLLFLVSSILLMSYLFGVQGTFASITVAEIVSVILAFSLLFAYRNYFKIKKRKKF